MSDELGPVERAAHAIREELSAQEPLCGGTYFVDADDLRNVVIDGTFDLHAIARAVLLAIRQPSAKMSRSGQLQVRDFDAETGSSYQTADRTFVAMIDAALHEGQTRGV